MYHAERGLAPFMHAMNRNPSDFSTDIMLLDSRALFLTIPYGFAWYLASFVQKLFTTFGVNSKLAHFFGHCYRSCSSLKWLAGEVSAIRFRYSTSCRFKAMRTPLTRMTL